MSKSFTAGAVLAILLACLRVAPASAEVAETASTPRAADSRVAVSIRTPAGVPGVVVLTSQGRKRVVTKRAGGITAVRTLRLPAGRWRVAPQPVVTARGVFVATASVGSLLIRAGRLTRLSVVYRAAPAVRHLRATVVGPTRIDVGWTAPPQRSVYQVRRVVGTRPATRPSQGTAVPVSGRTARATGLRPSTDYSFSVFARKVGASTWGRAVSIRATTDGQESVAVVVNPAAVLASDATSQAAAVTPDGVVVPAGSGTTATPGQPWVLPRSQTLPGGFIGTVAEVSDDGSEVLLAPGGVADAFDYLELRVPDLSRLPTVPQAGQHRRQAGLDCGGSASESVAVDATFDPYGHFDADLRKTDFGGLPVGMSFDVEIGVRVRVSADVSLAASAHCSLDLPAIWVPIPAGPVPLMFIAQPVLDLSVAGEFEVTDAGFTTSLGASVEGHLGLGGDDHIDGDLDAESRPLTPTTPGASGVLSLTAGVSVSVGPGLGNPATAGAMAGLTGNLNPVDASVTPDGSATCLKVQAGVSANLGLEAKAWLGDWDFSRFVSVPGLDGFGDYPGSPWHFPSRCGVAEYRIAGGSLDVSQSWSAGCQPGQGACDSDFGAVSQTFRRSGDAHLVIAEPGPWSQNLSEDGASLTAPMRFTSWDFTANSRYEYVPQDSDDDCTHVSTETTTGGVEFRGAFWETAARAGPEGTGLAFTLVPHLDWSEEWSDDWSQLGAHDTDIGNGYPRIKVGQQDVWGGACSETYTSNRFEVLWGLGPYPWTTGPFPEEGRRTSGSSTITPLEECTPTACRWRVESVRTYAFRSDYGDDGYAGSGTATVTYSYVVERRSVPESR